MYVRHDPETGRRRRLTPALAAALCLTLATCIPQESEREARMTLFVGIDVSGSFQNTGHYSDALRFAAHYIYGHLNGLGELEQPAVLFVGSIGGERPGEAKSFHPIHDFQGKTVDEIDADLRAWFQPDDIFTDFNPFFERVATFVKRQNLILKPITVVIISDGVPDVTARRTAAEEDDRYGQINLEPLEFLSRNVTLRLLYPSPQVAVRWEQDVERRRVRMWTVDAEAMRGWRGQITPGLHVDQQERLWTWIEENVDFRVRRRLL
ncbi:MAG: hypothetical protein JSV41_07875 [Gemmatimonadota bacterium]|nr:MAG: hypothetical protein JSV41_07875 [Gemmatimonadota bacterium]